MQELSPKGQDVYTATVKENILHLPITFDLDLQVTKKQEPTYVEAVAAGKGRLGIGRFSAKVTLSLGDVGGKETEVSSKFDYTVSGRVMNVGAKVIAGKAQGIADAFVERFLRRFEEGGLGNSSR